MSGFHTNIEKETLENANFRKVLFTAPHSQLVVMSLLPGEEIGEEIHQVDQFFRIEQGMAKVIFNDSEEFEVSADEVFIVPAGTKHNVVNTGSDKLKLYTIYSPAQHKDGTIHKTKAEAEADEEDHL